MWKEEVPRPETRFLSRGTKVSHNISALTAAATYTHMKEMYANRARFPQGTESTKVPRGMHIPCFPKRKKQNSDTLERLPDDYPTYRKYERRGQLRENEEKVLRLYLLITIDGQESTFRWDSNFV